MSRIIVSKEHRWWMNDSKITAICKYLGDRYHIKPLLRNLNNGDIVLDFNASKEQLDSIRKQLYEPSLRLIAKIED